MSGGPRRRTRRSWPRSLHSFHAGRRSRLAGGGGGGDFILGKVALDCILFGYLLLRDVQVSLL